MSDSKSDFAARHNTVECLQLAFDAAGMGWWQWDLTTGTVTGDARYKALLGLAPEIEASYEQVLHMVRPDDRAAFEAEVHRSSRGGCGTGVEGRGE